MVWWTDIAFMPMIPQIPCPPTKPTAGTLKMIDDAMERDDEKMGAELVVELINAKITTSRTTILKGGH